MADFDQELDASGLNCPLPILRTKKNNNQNGGWSGSASYSN